MAGSLRRQPQQHQSKQTSSSSSSSNHSFRNVDNQMVNLIMNEIMDHGPRVGFDDIGQCCSLNHVYVINTAALYFRLDITGSVRVLALLRNNNGQVVHTLVSK